MNQNRLFQNLIYLFFIAFSVYSLFAKQDNSPQTLLKLDTDFSNLCLAKGAQVAFQQYRDDSAVLLPSDCYPIGGEIAKQVYADQQVTLRLYWQPQAASIAESGELGYTYGSWTVAVKDTILKGTYVRNWRKKEDGSWKFVLNAWQNSAEKK